MTAEDDNYEFVEGGGMDISLKQRNKTIHLILTVENQSEADEIYEQLFLQLEAGHLKLEIEGSRKPIMQ
jgi:hypothetical protein